jgi:multiple antibiotic resistance protein
MFKTAIVAFMTLFVTVGPIDVAAMFAALTSKNTTSQRRSMAMKGSLIATTILLVFSIFGERLLGHLGISLPALRTAGGILLLLIGIDMVFARSSGGTSTTDDESREAALKSDISVFPLATPLIAGPGAMGACILLTADAEGSFVLKLIVITSMLAVMAVTLLFLLIAGRLQRLLGVTGLQVITRVAGVLLSALAVQFIFDGIRSSGLA